MEENKSYNLKRNEERVNKEYYIDNRGKVHKYNGDLNCEIISFHRLISKNLFPDIEHADDYVRKIGYVLVGSNVYSCPICDRVPTQSQINRLDSLGLLKRLCVLNNGYYHNYLENISKFE